MDSLSDTLWDVVICGTGLQQSLLALSLSRSGKKVLHIDPNEFYGGAEAAFSLQEVDSWAAAIPSDGSSIFGSAEVTRPAQAREGGLSFPRAYSLALAPQLIHARSKLLSQLVTSRVHRHLEFLAVGSFFIYKSPAGSGDDGVSTSALVRIPSTREDVFSTTAIPAKAKRALMKFMKLVVDYESDSQKEVWQPHADAPLEDFLRQEMKLDDESRAYILALTLTLDGRISTRDGLAAIFRHLSSMGTFGPGFAAVYPKWGGTSEIAQVACRAGAVGGGVYMLGTGIKDTRPPVNGAELLELELSNDIVVKTKMLVRGDDKTRNEPAKISRLVAVVGAPLPSLFEPSVEGAPAPAVAVVAFPPGSLTTAAGDPSACPIYAFVHSSDTGECPAGQCILYLSTLSSSISKELLEKAARSLSDVAGNDSTPPILYQLYYEQSQSSSANLSEGLVLSLPGPSFSLSFDDSTLEPVQAAWRKVVGETLDEGDDTEYMLFPEREGAQEDEMYD